MYRIHDVFLGCPTTARKSLSVYPTPCPNFSLRTYLPVRVYDSEVIPHALSAVCLWYIFHLVPIEPATYRFVAWCLTHYATASPRDDLKAFFKALLSSVVFCNWRNEGKHTINTKISCHGLQDWTVSCSCTNWLVQMSTMAACCSVLWAVSLKTTGLAVAVTCLHLYVNVRLITHYLWGRSMAKSRQRSHGVSIN
jgi:hypothetical protein